MEKLTENEKRKLAEFMGREIVKDEIGLVWIFEKKSDTSGLLLDEYNPDTNPEQFKEVLEHTSGMEKIQIDDMLRENYEEWDAYNVYLWIFDHMPEVIRAVLKVLTPKPPDSPSEGKGD